MNDRLKVTCLTAGLAIVSSHAAAQTPASPAASGPEATLPAVQVRGDRLQPSLPGLGRTTDTGSRLGLTIGETPASVYLVDRATIEARGDRTTQEALRNVPGISATDKPDTGGFLSYRGFTGSQITQLFNGITVQYDVVAARPVSSWIYDRVEVLGGPSSFLFGAGAVGGSIDSITKLAERSNFADGLVRLGTDGTAQAAVGLNRQISGEGARGNFLRIDVNADRNRTRIDGNDGRSQQAAVSLLSDVGNSLTHTAAVEYQHETLKRPYWGTPLLNPTVGDGRLLEGTRFKNYNSADAEDEQTVRWFRSLLEYRPMTGLSVKNTLYRYGALRDYRNVEEYAFNDANTGVARFSPLLQRHDQKLTGDRVEATYSTMFGTMKSDFAFGADYSLNKQTRFPNGPDVDVSTVDPIDFSVENFFDIPGLAPGFVPDRTVRVRTLAFFVENRTKVPPNVAIVTGLRHDRIDLDLTNRRTVTAASPATLGQNYSPTTGRAGVIWDVAPSASLYAQYATAADPPSGILTTASFAQARTNLDLTTGRQVEVGSKVSLWEGRATATVAAYRIVRKNLATPDPAAPSTTILVGQQSSRGIEVGLDARITRDITAQGNAAFVDPRYDSFSQVVSGTAVSLAGNTPPNTPRRVANLFVDYAFQPGWAANVGVRHVSQVFGDNRNTLTAPAYTLLDLGLDYRINKSFTVRTRVRNVTDRVYASNVTATPMFYLGQPRTADISLRAGF